LEGKAPFCFSRTFYVAAPAFPAPGWNFGRLPGYGKGMSRTVLSHKLPITKIFRGFSVALMALALAGCPVGPIEVPKGPLALFSVAPSTGPAPLAVTFTDETIPGTKPLTFWLWDFGDGETSNDPSPTHTYAEAGTYSVTLTVATVVGVDRRTKFDLIKVQGDRAPVADFRVDKQSGNAPLAVQFTDTSNSGTAEITSWLWDFGDGNTSTEQNPKHTYTKRGAFTVSLTVENEVGENTRSRAKFVTVRSKDLALGGAAADRAFGLGLTQEDRYVLAGDTESPDNGSRDFLLLITDAAGNTATEKRFGGEDDESASALVRAADGGFFLVGTVELQAGGADALVVRTDSAGNRLWSVTLGGDGDERANAATATRDGGLLLVGSTALDEIALPLTWAMRLDRDGRVQWSRSYGTGRFAAVATDGAGFVAAGASADGLDARLVRLDAQGLLLDETTYLLPGQQDVAGVVVLPEGTYAIAGTTTDAEGNSDGWAAQFDENLDADWWLAFGGDGQDSGAAIAAREDGGVAIAGSTQPEGSAFDNAYLVAITENGDLDWEADFGGAKADRAHALIAEADGGYALAGSTESFGTPGTNAYLVKTDEDGVQQSFPIAGRN